MNNDVRKNNALLCSIHWNVYFAYLHFLRLCIILLNIEFKTLEWTCEYHNTLQSNRFTKLLPFPSAYSEPAIFSMQVI